MSGHGAPPAAAGTVASVGTGTFTLNGRDATSVTVDVTSSTTYKDPKVTSPSFANVTVGEMVSVQGTTAPASSPPRACSSARASAAACPAMGRPRLRPAPSRRSGPAPSP